MQVITRGLNGLHLITRGLFSATADQMLRDVIQVDMTRCIVQTDMLRDVVRGDMTRQIIQTPQGAS